MSYTLIIPKNINELKGNFLFVNQISPFGQFKKFIAKLIGKPTNKYDRKYKIFVQAGIAITLERIIKKGNTSAVMFNAANSLMVVHSKHYPDTMWSSSQSISATGDGIIKHYYGHMGVIIRVLISESPYKAIYYYYNKWNGSCDNPLKDFADGSDSNNIDLDIVRTREVLMFVGYYDRLIIRDKLIDMAFNLQHDNITTITKDYYDKLVVDELK